MPENSSRLDRRSVLKTTGAMLASGVAVVGSASASHEITEGDDVRTNNSRDSYRYPIYENPSTYSNVKGYVRAGVQGVVEEVSYNDMYYVDWDYASPDGYIAEDDIHEIRW